MTATERLKALLEGKPVDRMPATVWKHTTMVDRNQDDFFKKTVQINEENEWDLIKICHNGFYFIEDMGCEIEWPSNEIDMPRMVHFAINDPYDWKNLKPLSVKKGAWKREIEFTKRLADYYQGRVPILGTVFSPFTTAGEMTGGYPRREMIVAQLHHHPQVIEKALEQLTEMTIEFSVALAEAGADGIFLADQFGSRNFLTPKEHETFVRKYDLQVLDAIRDKTWFNMLHVHGYDNLMMQCVKDYPVQAFNWEDRLGNYTLADMRAITDKILVGGIDQAHDFECNDREQLKELFKNRIREAKKAAGEKLIIAPGCVVPTDVPEYKFNVLREAVNEVSLEE
jgi:uroporphyrinogen decarboxylase